MRYWIDTVSRDHTLLGVQGGFTQADHGKGSRLARLDQGGFIAFYSPRTDLVGGEPLQAFTALGAVVDDEPYRVEMDPDFHPWRRRVAFLPSREAPIRPLIEKLAFIQDKRHWGHPFRRGLFEVERSDFRRIAEAMDVALDDESRPAPTNRNR